MSALVNSVVTSIIAVVTAAVHLFDVLAALWQSP